MGKKLIALISDSRILLDSLIQNIDNDYCDFLFLKEKNEINHFLNSPKKIDILIIEKVIPTISDLSIYSKYIFSFIDSNVRYQIDMRKPLDLGLFINEILAFLKDDKIFCIIDNTVIYCELKSSFFIKNSSFVKLSSIENKIMKSLILAKDNYVSKDILQKNVWKYSSDSETKTIDQKMQYLKNALPSGLLRNFSEGYKLFPENIS